jgi:NAD+ synthase (glutamine-hydrolysing)
MKIALAQQNYHIGNFEENTRKIIEGIDWAKKQGADIVMFSELCVCGYPPRDFLEFEDFINKCYKAIDIIKQHTIQLLLLLAHRYQPCKERKDLFTLLFLYEKEVKAVAHKTCYRTMMYLMSIIF